MLPHQATVPQSSDAHLPMQEKCEAHVRPVPSQAIIKPAILLMKGPGEICLEAGNKPVGLLTDRGRVMLG